MATYEVEHSIPTAPPPSTASRPRRPSLTTFFSALDAIDTSSTQNLHAVPTPGDVSAAYRMLANAFEVMRGPEAGRGDTGAGQHTELLDMLIGSLMADAEHPPREVAGVSEEWLTDLDRVPKKSLKSSDVCPICNNPFLDDKYPLVVRLPCHKSHIFDLECIAPWLRLNTTCPLDRKDLLKKEERPPTKVDVEDVEEYDDMYA